ncbi:uncharacterized protein LOC120666877 isoform X2 [Panicum virgatum]|uniref:uncharacterized protein LOC120666877 isoform X2 n=1 Tax=Panicum virgatum TaxID=38727 RepID=UPI0019D63CBB|nr:uncharacterized protein LOC120666877 isoform X2 [Panicum virgatum]
MALGFHPMKYFLPLDRNRPAWAARIRNLESTTGTPQLSQEPRRTAAKNGGDEPRRGVSNRRHLPGTEYLPSRDDRGAGERRRPARRPSTDAAAKGDEREGEGSTASTAKKSRKLDIEKVHVLGEINKSLQASLKSAEPLHVPKELGAEECVLGAEALDRSAMCC